MDPVQGFLLADDSGCRFFGTTLSGKHTAAFRLQYEDPYS